MYVRIYNTGSSGNMAVIDDFLIIDAGFGANPMGSYILLTHAHTDHTKALPKLGGVPVYALDATAEKLAEKYPYLTCGRIEPRKPILFSGTGVEYLTYPVGLVHDIPCVGFEITRVRNKDGKTRRILWLTDFSRIVDEGYIINHVRERWYDHIYIECNNSLVTSDLVDCYLTTDETPLPRDEFHRTRSFQTHCNVRYLESLFTRAGATEANPYPVPVTLLHKSTYYYDANPAQLERLFAIANIQNP